MWRTGKGIVGKSAKFELGFRSVRIGGRDYKLRGMHWQEAGAIRAARSLAQRS